MNPHAGVNESSAPNKKISSRWYYWPKKCTYALDTAYSSASSPWLRRLKTIAGQAWLDCEIVGQFFAIQA